MQAQTSLASWNGVRHRAAAATSPASRGHVESYFFKLNDPEGRRALWVKATVLARLGAGRLPVAEAWAIAFDRDGGHVAAKETVPVAKARFAPDALGIQVAELVVEEGRLRGAVTGSALTGSRARIAFDLRFDAGAPALVPFPSARMYSGPLPSSKLVSPHPDSRFEGSYSVDGERVDVAGWRGMQGHNWGTKHAELYAWCHANQWDDDQDFVLEGLTGRVKVGPVLAPALTLVCVRHRGVRYDMNGPLTLLRARGEIGARRWSFQASSALAEVSGEVWAETRDFVGLAYENPIGDTTYCLNSKIARARVRLAVRGRPPLDLITRAAALEIGTKDPKHGIAMLA